MITKQLKQLLSDTRRAIDDCTSRDEAEKFLVALQTTLGELHAEHNSLADEMEEITTMIRMTISAISACQNKRGQRP